jgi:glutathione S-transferase
MTAPNITLCGSELSGHTHRVELLLRALDLPYRFVSTPANARRSADFLSLFPLGQVPVLPGFKPMAASPVSVPT